MRTCAGKTIKQGPSGKGAKLLTEKEEWILRNFGFLRDHIKRVPSRQGVHLHRTGRTKRTSEDDSSSSSTVQVDSDAEVPPPSAADPEEFMEDDAVPPPGKGKGKGKSSKKRRTEVSASSMQELMSAALKTGQVIEKKQKEDDPHHARARAFSEMLYHEFIQMDEETYEDVRIHFMNHIHNVQKTLRQKTQQQQQQQQFYPQQMPQQQQFLVPPPPPPPPPPPHQQCAPSGYLQVLHTPEKQWPTYPTRAPPPPVSAVAGPSSSDARATTSSTLPDSGPPSISSLLGGIYAASTPSTPMSFNMSFSAEDADQQQESPQQQQK
jgi:hypothetical protein